MVWGAWLAHLTPALSPAQAAERENGRFGNRRSGAVGLRQTALGAEAEETVLVRVGERVDPLVLPLHQVRAALDMDGANGAFGQDDGLVSGKALGITSIVQYDLRQLATGSPSRTPPMLRGVAPNGIYFPGSRARGRRCLRYTPRRPRCSRVP